MFSVANPSHTTPLNDRSLMDLCTRFRTRISFKLDEEALILYCAISYQPKVSPNGFRLDVTRNHSECSTILSLVPQIHHCPSRRPYYFSNAEYPLVFGIVASIHRASHPATVPAPLGPVPPSLPHSSTASSSSRTNATSSNNSHVYNGWNSIGSYAVQQVSPLIK